MPPVPDNVLNWLYSVLTNEYRDVNRTYNDTAQVLTQYPSLRPKTEVYTYEHGTSALLLLLAGTVPVQFRGQVFHFPVHLWIPHAYPREAPIGFVVPNDSMLVRPGQHVSGEGKIYHPYLAKWPGFWDKSSLLDLVAILREVFAKEPPVISKQAVQTQPQQPRVAAAPTPPPPLPPPPEDWRRQPQPTPQTYAGASVSAQQHSGQPPPLPPKGADSQRPTSMSPANGGPRSPNQGPPLPPLPPPHAGQHQMPPQARWQDPTQPRIPYTSRQGSMHSEPSPYTPNSLPPHLRYEQQSHHELESPVSPITPSTDFPPQQAQYPPQYRPPQQQHAPPPNPYQQPQQRGPPPPPTYNQMPPNYQYQQPPAPAVVQRQPPPPQIDLLSSPLDVQLPGQGQPAELLPVPPVPPNPQKDALLHALSQALVVQANQTIANNNTALQSLSAQHQALVAAQQTLQTELDSLAHLSSILDGNESALRQGLSQIDSSIASASSQRRPEIDAIIICPTIVGQQVYNAVAEEQAARDVRLALGRALDRGRIGAKEFVKEMRGVGREEFFRKAIVRKAGVGMGLELGGLGGGQSWR